MLRFLLLLFPLLLFNCSDDSIPESDITIVNANIYYQNENSSRSIAEEMLSLDADIYILIEAAFDANVDSAFYEDNGYELYEVRDNSISGSMVIATRIPGELGEIQYERALEPSVTLRIPYNNEFLSIVGVHPPAPYYSSQEDQKKAFEELRKLGEHGRAATDAGSMKSGDLLILAGDFNSFPTDPNMEIITDMGLEDGAFTADNPYQYTWGPHISPTTFARIDYLFASPEVNVQYQGVTSIEGSDHEAVVTGVNY